MSVSNRKTANGRGIVITGATSGIGLAAAEELARQGAAVIGVGRSKERGLAAGQHIRQAVPHADITYLTADLSSQDEIRNLAQSIRGHLKDRGWSYLDVLINNAGMVTNLYTATENGCETQFAVNHLAPFLLTWLLFPLLKAAPAARVLTTSSGSHRGARIHWKDVMLTNRYNTLRAYRQSKLANVLFSSEFNRRFSEVTAVRAFAIDPGLVNTGIGLKGTSGLVRWVWKRRRRGGVTPEEGARTLIHVAADPSVNKSAGVYWKDCRPARPGRSAQNEEDAARLWKLSERLCGIEEWK